MLSTGSLRLITLFLYLWLVACVAGGRPRLAPPRTAKQGGEPGTAAGFPRSLEALWLGSIAAVLLFPLLALIGPSFPRTSGLTVQFPGDEVAQAIGIGLVLAAGLLVGWAFRSLGRFTTVDIRLAPDHTIVRSGPYRWVRHPMYSANMALSIGVTLLFLSLPLLVPVVAIVTLALVRARVEESLFLGSERLGREYSTYRAETGRFFPLIHRRFRRMA